MKRGASPRIEADMRLAEFIPLNLEAILVQWEVFATSLHPGARNMTPLALRDHAQQILEAVVADLSTTQTRQAQADKSKGRQLKQVGAPETAAETHAILRARSGFDINQLVAEYRALRASVLRVWMDACQPDAPNLGPDEKKPEPESYTNRLLQAKKKVWEERERDKR